MGIRDRLQNIYGSLKRTIVPSLQYSQAIYEDVLTKGIETNSTWLDVGCGHHLLPPWRYQQEKDLMGRADTVVGIDMDFPSLVKHRTIDSRICGGADSLPFVDGSFDTATANMVVEHLDNPQVQFAEINRVLKPGAKFIFHTPNKTGYFAVARRLIPGKLATLIATVLDGRAADDVFPIQYKANSEECIKRLAEDTNFEVERIRFVSSDAVCSIVPPIAALELLWIKLLMSDSLRRYRTNLIVTLRKRT
jgi:ubiquinone/menaquinone biosynthesis C-methylase UbiE